MEERNDHFADKGSITKPSSKQRKAPPPVPEGWDRCCAYIPKKNRFCNQRHLRDRFCGNHYRLLANPLTEGRKRIPCPIDPSHSIYEDQMVKHKRICPRVKALRKQAECSYYRSRVNSGGYGKLASTSSEEEPNLEWSKRVALRVLQVYQNMYGNEEVSAGQDLSKLTANQLFDQIPLLDLSKKELDAGFSEALDHYSIRSGGSKQLVQQASLIGHMRRIGALPTHTTDDAGTEKDTIDKISPLVLLEMGAGRGMLGLATTLVACGAGLEVRFVMVERSTSRNKADSTLRSQTGDDSSNPHPQYMKIDPSKIEWSRVQCDLSHVHLPSVLQQGKDGSSSNGESSTSKRNIVVVAKHLCGAGTDLALKSLHPIKDQLKACVIATCCHGVCSWDDYVGRDYLRLAMEDQDISFGPAEFDLLRRWSSGTVKEGNSPCCQKPRSAAAQGDAKFHIVEDDTHREHVIPDLGGSINSISEVVKALGLACDVQGLGRACQRLIDHGRCEYMRCDLLPEQQESECGATELLHYVSADVTPQNAVLVSAYQE
jgi:tRNA:m4X modification enzyme